MVLPYSPRTSTIDELFRIASERTAERMNVWSRGSITLRPEGSAEVALHEIGEHLGGNDRMATMVLLEAQGEIGGMLVLLFDDGSLTTFLQAMSGEPVAAEGRSSIHESVLLETGNILASAFTGTITDLTGYLVLPSPPVLLTDYAASVLQQACLDQAISHELLVLTKTRFERHGKVLDWQLIFVPNSSMRDWLDSSDAWSPISL